MKKAFYAKPYTIKSQRPIPHKRIRISRAKPVIKEEQTQVTEKKPEINYRYHCLVMMEIDGVTKKCDFKSNRWKTMQTHILEMHMTQHKKSKVAEEALQKEITKSMEKMKNAPWTNRP